MIILEYSYTVFKYQFLIKMISNVLGVSNLGMEVVSQYSYTLQALNA